MSFFPSFSCSHFLSSFSSFFLLYFPPTNINSYPSSLFLPSFSPAIWDDFANETVIPIKEFFFLIIKAVHFAASKVICNLISSGLSGLVIMVVIRLHVLLYLALVKDGSKDLPHFNKVIKILYIYSLALFELTKEI